MSGTSPKTPESQEREAVEEIEKKAARKAAARQKGERSVWFGLGMFGLVGWSVAVPTLIGIALGVWIDARIESDKSWTLALLLAGAALGSLNAWYWVSRESRDD